MKTLRKMVRVLLFFAYCFMTIKQCGEINKESRKRDEMIKKTCANKIGYILALETVGFATPWGGPNSYEDLVCVPAAQVDHNPSKFRPYKNEP